MSIYLGSQLVSGGGGGGGGAVGAVRDSDLVRSESTAVADTQLTFAAEANATYLVSLAGDYQSYGGNIYGQILLPSGASAYGKWPDGNSVTTESLVNSAGVSVYRFELTFLVKVGGTAGNVTFAWRGDNAYTAATLEEGSWLIATKLS